MGEYFRLKGEHVRRPLAQGDALFSEGVDGDASVVAAHLPPVSLVVVLVAHPSHLRILQSADL